MRKIFMAILLFAAVLSSCKKVTETQTIAAELDKEIMITFPVWYWSTQSATYETLPNYSHLIDFNKNDYISVDSIVLIAGLRTDNPADTVFVRLINVTENTEIANSTITANTIPIPSSDYYAVVQSKNIYASLPNKKITIGVQLRSKIGGPSYVYVMKPYLKLRRR